MNEIVGVFLVGIIGFFIGGVVGLFQHVGFFPYAWYGFAIGIVLVLGGCICCVLD